jgi:subtilase family serine protease
MRSRSSLSFLLSAVLLFAFTPLVQAAAPQNRIDGAINGNNRLAVPGNINGHVKHAVDLGAAPANQRLETLTLRFSMTAAQQADLSQLLAAQLDPTSPSYHQWLTPEQFGARFGLSSADLGKVSSWLTSQGFTITGVARSSTFINFSGTVAQAQQALGTSIHTLSYNGEQHIANVTDPVLPSAVAAVVTSITGLNDFRPKPHSRPHNASPIDPTQPLFTQTTGTTTSHYIAPADLYTIYDYPWTPAGVASATNTGAGITIAVMGQTDLTSGNTLPDANIAAFRNAAGLPAINLTVRLAPGSVDPGISTADIDEAHIDVEWSGSAAPGASILYYYGRDALANSLTQAIDNKVAPILSISYGLCEPSWGTAMLATYNQTLAQANAQGQTVVSSSGDSGATDCDVDGLASEGLAVDFPGSSPYVTSAGGTMFSGDVSSPSSYWNSTNGTGSGSAISYIPEMPWNETTASQALTAGGAGGGGASAFFSKPAWQTGTGVPADSSRDVPDFSFNAAAMHDGYLVCSSGDGSNEPACTNGFVSSTNLVNVFGGTSFVAPTFAGVLALVEQKLGNTTGLGNVGPVLYGFLNDQTYYPMAFHDITTGNNSVPCSQGTLNCPNGGSIGFSAGTGYDQASGVGSIDVSKLVNNWSAITPTGTGSAIGAGVSTTTITTNPTTMPLCGISTSTTLPLTVTVTGTISGVAPTGTVQIWVDNQTMIASQTLANGTASIPLSLSSITSGGHVISAVYSGDGNYAGSKGSLLGPATNTNAYPNGPIASVDFVSGSKADFSITPCVNGTGTAVSVLPGATAAGITLTITPLNGFTGTVSLTATNNDAMISTTAFTPTSVNITSGALTTSFVVQAFGTTTANLLRPSLAPAHQHPSGKTPWYTAASGATLAGLLLFTLPRRRRWSGLLILFLSAAALTAVGCGSSSSNTGGGGGGGGGGGSPTSNATAGTYTFTITAVSGSTVHSTQVTVTVP